MAKKEALTVRDRKDLGIGNAGVNGACHVYGYAVKKAGHRVTLHFNHGSLSPDNQAFFAKFLGEDEETMNLVLRRRQPDLPGTE